MSDGLATDGLSFCIKIHLTLVRINFTLKTMTKQEIKKKLLDAVRRDSHLADINSVAIFGSYVNGTPSEDSDIDILIDFEPTASIGFFALSDIKNNFETALKKTVDLLTPQAISEYFRNEVLAQSEYIYEKQ